MHERENFRQFLDRLRAKDQLADIREPVDSRHIATLVDQSDKALMFHRVLGYQMPVVSGLIRSSERMAIAALPNENRLYCRGAIALAIDSRALVMRQIRRTP